MTAQAPPPGGSPRVGASADRAEPAPASLATSGPGQVAAAFALALARAARSFNLYDAGNSVVRQFLADYQVRAEAATEREALVLDVRPFELLREGEVVYREEDRERSLAFRLFRDGLRRLTFEPGVPWEELLTLLEIVAIRLTGVRQQEEDLVSLLRKAELRHVGITAVEGFVPEEDNPEPPEPRRRRGEGASPPAGWDAPFPLLPPPGPLAWREVPEAWLAPLRAEELPASLAQAALRLATFLLQELGRGVLSPREVEGFLADLRDFLVADAALPALAALADLVARQPTGELRDGLLRSLGDARVLQAVLARIPPGTSSLPPEASRLVPLVPVSATLDLLAAERDEGRRAVLLEICQARLPAEAEAVVARLPALSPASALALVQAVAARAPALAAAAAGTLLDHPDEATQIAALEALGAAEGEVPVDRLLRLLGAPGEAVRVAAAQVLGRHAEAAAFPAVAASLAERKEYSREEAVALGRCLARVDPPRALPLLERWLAPRPGLLGRLTATRHDELLRWAAVAGLGAHVAPDAAARIEAVAKGAEEALRRHCYATLARRRHEGGRGG
jgi:hypothetical protein